MSYHRPTDLMTTLEILSGFDGAIVAGGTDFYPSMQPGRRPTSILDVTAIEEMRGITNGPDGIRIGGATSWTDVIRTDLSPAFDGLKHAAAQVGSVQIQNAGSVAGNLCNASPAADGVPPLLTLDAEVELASAARGTRRLGLSDFLLGVRQTALAPDELLTAIHLPHPPVSAGSAFEKLGSRTQLVISIAMVAAVIARDVAGSITDARVAVGSCGPVAKRLTELEASLIGLPLDAVSVTSAHLTQLSPITDMRGSAEYRSSAVRELCLRAIRKAAGHE